MGNYLPTEHIAVSAMRQILASRFIPVFKLTWQQIMDGVELQQMPSEITQSNDVPVGTSTGGTSPMITSMNISVPESVSFKQCG